MTLAIRALILSLALGATLAGCNRDKPAETPAAPPATGAAVTPAEAAAPMAYESATPYAEVKLTLPVAIKTQPDLHAALYARSVADLRAFMEGAQADLSEAGADSDSYGKSISVTPGAETGKLFSLARIASEDVGGPHPNAVYSSILWDKALKREIGASDLFIKGANLGALDAMLCAAINAEKKKRNPAAASMVSLTAGTWTCPRVATAPFVLASGGTPGKAGGLVFPIAPGQVGPYLDGPYEVTLPQSAFRALIAPAYADEFGGEPKPAAG